MKGEEAPRRAIAEENRIGWWKEQKKKRGCQEERAARGEEAAG